MCLHDTSTYSTGRSSQVVRTTKYGTYYAHTLGPSGNFGGVKYAELARYMWDVRFLAE